MDSEEESCYLVIKKEPTVNVASRQPPVARDLETLAILQEEEEKKEKKKKKKKGTQY